MSSGNHECRLLVDIYPGRDNPRFDRSTVRVMVFNATSTIFQLYMVIRFIGGGNRSIRGKTTDLSQVTDKLYHQMLYRLHLARPGFELTTLVMIVTDWIESCKSNYHPITTTIAVAVVHIVISLFKVRSFSSMDWLSYIAVNVFTDHLKGVYKHLLYLSTRLHVLFIAKHNRYWTKMSCAVNIHKKD